MADSAFPPPAAVSNHLLAALPPSALAQLLPKLRHIPLEQMRRQPLDARAQRQLDQAQWGTRRAARLARQLLVSARNGGGETTEAGVVDLNEAVIAFALMKGRDVGKDARFAVELASGPLPARLDAGQLELALFNLIHNATDATAGGGQVVVRTAGHRVDGLGERPTVEVMVSDTGTGMTPEAARHATDPFFTTKGQERGTGLGSWMVRRFAEEAGGKVEIETAPG